MTTTTQLSLHLKRSYFGPNWTAVSLKEQVQDITWKEAQTKVYDLNTLLALVFHINYYISGVLEFLENGRLEIRDKFSFDHSHIQSQEAWEQLKKEAFAKMEAFSKKIAELEDEVLQETFFDEKYGNYFQNFLGILEHTYYHLGQVAIIKKILRNKS